MRLTLFLLLLFMTGILYAQQQVPLYEGKVINSKEVPDEEVAKMEWDFFVISKISKPSLTVYLPQTESSDRAAVIICPGGGYWVNAITHEGIDVAKQFAEKGIVAFVLKYRIPSDRTMNDREIGALQDLQQAIKVVRENARNFHVDPAKIGIMGFSAGGHLASTAGTHFATSLIDNKKNTSLRPDFMILIYPVISFTDSIGHLGSRENLLGKKPSREKILFYSNEFQVSKDTPPSFLIHASDDEGVKPENSILFYQSLIRHGVKAELHIYQNGGHGFGLNNKTTSEKWFDRCISWMAANRWIRL